MERATVLAAIASVLLAAMTGLATVKLGSFQHQLKAVLIVVAAMTMVIAALRPELGLTILIAISPFQFAFYGVNSNELMLILLALVLAWRIRARAVPVWMGTGGLVLVAGGFIAVAGAHDQGMAVEGALEWLCAIALLFVACKVLRERADASRRMVEIFVGSAMLVTLFGFLQKAGVTAVVGAPFNPGLPNSFFSYYTVYAGYLAMVITLATVEILIALGERRLGRVLVFSAAVVFMLVALTASTSRGGIVALGTAWVVLLALNVQRANVAGRIVVVLAVFGAAASIAIPHSTIITLEHRFAQSNGALGEDKTRFAVQHAGAQALSSHPLGLGYGNFPFYVSSFVRNSHVRQPFFHAQETFLQVGLNAGWLGLAGFVVLLGAPIALVMTRGRGGSSTVRATGFAAAIVGFMAQGLYDYLFWDLAYFVPFMAMLWGVHHALQTDAKAAERAGRGQVDQLAVSSG